MGSQTVKPLTKLTYLGSEYGCSIAEIYRRLGIANSIMGQLDRVWKQQATTAYFTGPVRIFVPVRDPGHVMRKVDSENIQAFRMTLHRPILGIKWFDHIMNTAVSEQMCPNDLPHKCRRKPERAPPTAKGRVSLNFLTTIFSIHSPSHSSGVTIHLHRYRPI